MDGLIEIDMLMKLLLSCIYQDRKCYQAAIGLK